MSESVSRALQCLSVLLVGMIAALSPPIALAETPVEPGGSAPTQALTTAAAPMAGLLGEAWRDHFSLRSRGLEFRSEVVVGERSLKLRVSGPLVRGAPGLRLELRGWSIRGAATTLSAYGSPRRQGIRLKIEF